MTRAEPASCPPGPAAAPSPAATNGPAPVWPDVLAAVSIVMAARALLGSNVAGRYAVSQMVSAFEGTGLAPPSPLECLTLGLGLLGGAAGVLLAVAGLLLWRRRRGGALHVAYAVAFLVALGGMCFVQVWRCCTSPSKFGLVLIYHYVGTTLAALPYPIFVLVWFLRKKVRRQMRAWRRMPPPERPRPQRGSAWPPVVGVLSIVLGGAGTFTWLWRIGAPLWQRFVAPDLNMDWGGGLNLWSTAAFAALSLPLLVAGWMLVRRRLRPAAICHLICAGLIIVATIALPLLWLAFVRDWSGTPATLLWLLPSMVSWVFQTLAYPVFVLVWFLRRKIRAQVNSPPGPGGARVHQGSGGSW